MRRECLAEGESGRNDKRVSGGGELGYNTGPLFRR